ncbi:ATP-dependent DNA helicase RecG [hydrothermal vent metagenome]|uniref:ATP-dependent DNA helicase RecG n=1 Tax=hydrothermal vent metagenome TaxID=652676 RepID=A0A3B0YHY9_9ZZZZ
MDKRQLTPDESIVTLDKLPVSTLRGVGPKSAEKLAGFGLETVQDVLFHLPRRYEDRTRIVPLGGLRVGDHAVIDVDVDLSEVKSGQRRSLLVHVSDGTGKLVLRFFYFNKAQQQNMSRGVRLRIYGEVRRGPTTLEMIHPEYQLLGEGEQVTIDDRLTPVYPTTEGLHQLTLRKLTEQAVALLQPGRLPEWLPQHLLESLDFSDLLTALRYVHRPPADADCAALETGTHPYQQRLAFEEMLAHHLSLRRIRLRAQHFEAPRLAASSAPVEDFIKSLPFKLTGAQQRVIKTLLKDIAQPHPMMRLVQGDVGSGKTVVAAAAAIQAIASQRQVALMAPTELLAEQHFTNFKKWFSELGIEVGWLTGKVKGKARKQVLRALGDGELMLVIGTHALFQDGVAFKHLGLVIIDEQHRFGVHQRLALRDKGRGDDCVPHQLIMTATPIPRTLSMTLYADLDSSVIDELPPGRIPVQTVVIPESRRDEVVLRVHNACREGRQAYWVCTLIEESESLQCQAAEDSANRLSDALPALNVALVHGRMKEQEKTQCMAAFKAGEINLLVATTVIEVGVDVPNASLMIIENAERLGLSQLHQLRGRVGRGSAQSSCVLIYRAPLSQLARQRLAVLRESNDGFEISRKDLELRGPGEVLGTRQTGMLQFRIADLMRDQALLDKVEQAALYLIAQQVDSINPIIRRWLGHAPRYGEV